MDLRPSILYNQLSLNESKIKTMPMNLSTLNKETTNSKCNTETQTEAIKLASDITIHK